MEFKDVSQLRYTEAINELGEIIRKMQGENCDIDLLADYTRRASALIAECRRRLTNTENEVNRILNQPEN